MKILYKQLNLRIFEDLTYNYSFDSINKFNLIHRLAIKNVNKIHLNFGFKQIKFEKKRMIPFFFFLELLTNQKSVITLSKKNIMNLKIKKGAVTGCKITLINSNLYEFLDSLLIALPRSDSFKGFNFEEKKFYNKTFSSKLTNLFMFYVLETEYVSFIKTLDIVFTFNTYNNWEKSFLLTYLKYPLQLNKE